jgi:ParB-like chromosome segregation protein Spo0J
MIIESLRSLAVSVSTLTLDPDNVRLHDDKNLDAIKKSLSRFGQRKPVVVRRSDRVVIAGNGTLTAAKGLGWSEVAAVFVDDDSVTSKAYAIADNRTAELAQWDDQELVRTLDLIRESDVDAFMSSGFTEVELDGVRNLLDWNSDLAAAAVDAIDENEDGILASIKITVPQELKSQVLAAVKTVVAQFDGVKIA